MDERTIADALVSIVCHCGPTQHVRGFPECHTARKAALAVLALIQGETSDRILWESPEYDIDEKVMVCIAHLCFVPCRHGEVDDPCRKSTDPADVERVRRYQRGGTYE